MQSRASSPGFPPSRYLDTSICYGPNPIDDMGLTGVEQVSLPGPSRRLVGRKLLVPDALFSPLLSRRNA